MFDFEIPVDTQELVEPVKPEFEAKVPAKLSPLADTPTQRGTEETSQENLPISSDKSMDLNKKTFIRMIRRFYSKLYVKENIPLQRRRFKTVDFKVQLQACKEFVLKYFEEDSDDFALYMLRILDFKAKNKPAMKLECEIDADNFLFTARSFSRERFLRVHESKFFRKVFCHLYTGTLPGSEKLWMDLLIENEDKNMRKDSEGFLKLFEEMYHRCLD